MYKFTVVWEDSEGFLFHAKGWLDDGGSFHDTIEAAEAEMEKLSKKRPYRTYYVMQAIRCSALPTGNYVVDRELER